MVKSFFCSFFLKKKGGEKHRISMALFLGTEKGHRFFRLFFPSEGVSFMCKTINSHRHLTTEHKEFLIEQADQLNGSALEGRSLLDLCYLFHKRFRVRVHSLVVRRLLRRAQKKEVQKNAKIATGQRKPRLRQNAVRNVS